MSYNYLEIQEHSPKWLVDETLAVAVTSFIMQFAEVNGIGYKDSVKMYINNHTANTREIMHQLYKGFAEIEHKKDLLNNTLIKVTFNSERLKIL